MTAAELHAKLDLSTSLVNAGKFDAVLSACDDVERIVSSATALTDKERDLLRVRVMKDRGDAFSSSGEFEQAGEQLAASLALAEQGSDSEIIARVHLSLSSNEFRQHRFPEMIGWLMRGVELSDDTRDKALLAGLYCNLGVAWGEIGELPKALSWYEKALPLAEASGHKAFFINICNNLGGIFDVLGDYASSRKYHERCLALAVEINNTGSIGDACLHLAGQSRHSKDHDAAIQLFKRALETFSSVNDISGIALAKSGIGSVYSDQERYDEALEFKRGALASLADENIPSTEAQIFEDMGLILTSRHASDADLTLAEEYLRRAVELNTRVDAKGRLSGNYKKLERLHVARGEWQSAYKAVEQQRELESTIGLEEAASNARMLEHRRQVESEERDRQVKLARFQEQERIFHNILPESIADRLIDGETTIADSFDNVSIFFSDIVGFTTLASQVSATELVNGLNDIFTEFDRLAALHGLEKIKTIGDAYMAVCGVPVRHDDHAKRVAQFSLDVMTSISSFKIGHLTTNVQLRIGLHTGTVVAGIIGTQRFAYDLWGDTVNVASRMESTGEAGRIQVSEQFKEALSPLSAKETGLGESPRLTLRGETEIKGKGAMQTYWLESRLP